MNLRTYYNKQKFQPDFFSVLINPFYIIRKELYREIRRYAPKLKGKLLDFGCGSKPYQNLFEVESYIGVDIAESGHPHHNEKIDVFYDGKTLPFPDNTFDSMLCSETLEHVFNVEEILCELKRVLKNDAQVLITVPFSWDEHEAPYDFGRYTSFGIHYLLEKHGFRIIEHKKTNHYIAVICQYVVLYVYHLLYTRNPYLNLMLNLLFIAPLMIISILIIAIAPKNMALFHNNVIYAQLKKS
jgi:ubiquinone/menaquinone biosynthesis C-methylase UbiE